MATSPQSGLSPITTPGAGVNYMCHEIDGLKIIGVGEDLGIPDEGLWTFCNTRNEEIGF
jgi:hypothetical protein